jgi:Protein of unknown function (DUF2877)
VKGASARADMQLAAISTGGQAPRGRFNGAVHSSFRQAGNIRLDDGRMLALLAPQLCNVPHGVRLDVPTGFAFAHHLTVGQRVGCRVDVLRVAGGELSIDLGAARPWRGELPAGVNLSDPGVARAWRAAWHALDRARPGTDHEEIGLLTRAVDRQGVRLALAVRAEQADEAARAVDRLIGRGPGLTPSGDDMIVGLLAGLWSTTRDLPARCALLDALCGAVAAAAEGTGEISRVYLTHATRGRFAEALITLAGRIAESADHGAVEAATAAALRVGHTSGGDGAFGLLLGLGVWAPQSSVPDLPGPAGPARRSDGSAGPDLGEARHDSSRPRLVARSATGSAEPDTIESGPAIHRSFSRDHRPAVTCIPEPTADVRRRPADSACVFGGMLTFLRRPLFFGVGHATVEIRPPVGGGARIPTVAWTTEGCHGNGRRLRNG